MIILNVGLDMSFKRESRASVFVESLPAQGDTQAIQEAILRSIEGKVLADQDGPTVGCLIIFSFARINW